MAEKKSKAMEASDEKPLKDDVKVKLETPKTFTEKLSHVKRNITVEPLLAGLIIPSIISKFAMANFNIEKACRVNLAFDDEICDALINKTNNNYSMYEMEVQKLIASIDIWKGVIHTALPCIIIMFLGGWSDKTGKRKICILLPIFGEVLTSINNLINVYFFYEIPVQVTVFLETFFPAITGGWVTMFLGVFSYISDITSEETRTFRVGLVNLCMTAGLPIGISLSGILLQRMGYYGIFTMTTAMFLVVLAYGVFRLKEPDDFLRENGLPPIERESTSEVSFFDVTHVGETIAVAYRPRPSNRRVKVILTLFTVFILFGPSMSEHHIFYLFVRNQLNWDMVKFGLYTSYSILLHSIVPVAEFLNGTTFTSLRSIISKLVDKQETAKVNSLFSLTETLASLLFNPLYSWLYMRTLHVLPGTVFLVSAALIIPAAIVLISFYLQHKKEVRNERKEALEAEEKKEAEANTAGTINFYDNDTKDLNTKKMDIMNISPLSNKKSISNSLKISTVGSSKKET
ncbi:proton-coupled folate transporter-like isoform X2 [Achroia grisella]|uniref:proton-coupled folate transporter-like isoform X2 n=1 Tax=Achroia grisella TaxID=688607 RepID=UPI0027D330F6|nr:proton-coupled folate transporter-like isoform X2 [Achroia grisella]